jgi:hypothetical protein
MPRRLLQLGRLILPAAVIAVALPLAGGSGSVQLASTTVSAASAPPTVSRDAGTTVGIGTFNLLGAGHTTAQGNKPGYASGPTRMHYAVQIMAEQGASIYGLQELETPAWKTFESLASSTYDSYPGLTEGPSALANTIVWRRDTWKLVEAHLMTVQYFHGQAKPMPYVLLRNRATGDEIWVYNSHNPADTRGPAQKWRDADTDKEAALVKRLRAANPTIPVIITGDKNDRANYFCNIAPKTGMIAPNRAGVVGKTCTAPTDDTKIDWVIGTPDVTFTSYTTRRDALVKKTTDHSVVTTTINLPSTQVLDSGVEHVVLIDAQGLTRRALTRADGAATPTLTAMRAKGASTLNARTDPTSVDSLGNTLSMLSGRPVDPAYGGTGVGLSTDAGGTFAETAGTYISTIFDKVHNYGRRTAIFSSAPDADRIVSSYDSIHGGLDPYGVDNGQSKFDVVKLAGGDASVVNDAVDVLGTSTMDLSLVQLTSAYSVGAQDGFNSAAYTEALTRMDHQIARIRHAVSTNPTMAGHTLFIVTADHGATRMADPEGRPKMYRVPLIISGPGVAQGADLYALNPQFADPGKAQPSDSDAQPIRNGTVANFIDKMLRIPALPGSTLDPYQTFSVFPDDE